MRHGNLGEYYPHISVFKKEANLQRAAGQIYGFHGPQTLMISFKY